MDLAPRRVCCCRRLTTSTTIFRRSWSARPTRKRHVTEWTVSASPSERCVAPLEGRDIELFIIGACFFRIASLRERIFE
jgi:hypothetical protein